MTSDLLALAKELLTYIQQQFEESSSYFAEQYLTGSATSDGVVTIIYQAGNGSMTFGRSWSVRDLMASFSPWDAEDMAEILWTEEIDGPSGTGKVDVRRAEGLADNPQAVRWVDEYHV